MAATKCTCPECKVTFAPPKTAGGKINCPICKAKIALPSANGKSARPVAVAEDDDQGSNSTRLIVGACVAAGVLVFLLVGAALGLYVLRAARSGDTAPEIAKNETKAPTDPDKANPDPVIERPDPIERPKDNDPPSKDRDPIERPKDPPKKDPEPQLTPEEAKQLKINSAIDKGIVYLKKDLTRYLSDKPGVEGLLDGYHEGIVGFAAMTLLECGTQADDPLMQEAAAFIRKRVPAMAKTYNMSASLLFLDKLGDPKDLPLMKLLAVRLMAGQHFVGSWGYDCERIADAEEQLLLAYLTKVEPGMNIGLPGAKVPPLAARGLPAKVQNVAAVRWLNGVKPTFQPFEDMSNTQFAVLALWVAARNNIPVRSSMALASDYCLSTQAPDGSWGYTTIAAGPNRASMTCAGLLGIAVGRSTGRKPSDVSLQRGFKYLAGVFQGGYNPAGGMQGHGTLVKADANDDLYYLWSLERVCLIYGLQKVGGKDWYAWESDVLLQHQKPDGSWSDHHPGSVGTSFALLILKRVNVVKDLKIEDKIKDDVNKTVNIKDNK